MKRRSGFTLIEVMIIMTVLAIIGLLFSQAFSGARENYLADNENTAKQTLRAIEMGQKQIKEKKLLDYDADGVSEYADSIGQLLSAPGSGTEPIKQIGFARDWSYSGYCFQIESGPASHNEAGWVAWAWPVTPGKTGNLTFQIDCFGQLSCTTVTVFNTDGTQRPSSELAGKLKWEPVKEN
jgi:type II secretory pathway pseudopilin PulG